jgi:hypothetical protein
VDFGRRPFQPWRSPFILYHTYGRASMLSELDQQFSLWLKFAL